VDRNKIRLLLTILYLGGSKCVFLYDANIISYIWFVHNVNVISIKTSQILRQLNMIAK
jgi:hypothetical protein